jgi:hypothetical protein
MNTQTFTLSFAPTIVSEGDVPRNFAGIAYSGGVIPSYGWFGDVAIDLASMKVPTKSVFALLNHDPDQRAGHCEVINAGGTIEVSGTFSKTTEAGKQVASEFAEGAPWEFSVGINATFESYDKPMEVNVNGKALTVNGVFRHASVREVSFVPAGADPNTQAIAFGQASPSLNEEIDLDSDETQEKVNSLTLLNADLQMKLSAMNDDHAQMVAELNAKLSAEAEQTRVQFERANELEAALNQFKLDVRKEAVNALFADLNREPKEEAMLPYLMMDESVFSVVAADLRSMKPVALNPNLFKEVAVNGKEGASEISLSAQLFNQVAGVK